MDNSSRCQEHKNTPGRINDSSPEVVAHGEQSDDGDRTLKQKSRCQSIHRWVERRMGSPSGKQRNIREMEHQTSKNAYKCIGNKSISSLTVEHFKEYLRGKSILVARDNATTVAFINHQGGTRSWTLMQETKLQFNKIHNMDGTIKDRHIPWSTESKESNTSNRMVYSPSRSGRVMENLGQTPCRLIRNKTQCQTTIVHEFTSAQLHFSCRCSSDGLVQPIRLCLPSNRIIEIGNQEDNITQMHNHLNSTTLVMVSRSSEDIHGIPKSTALSSKLLQQPQSHMCHQYPIKLALHAWKEAI